MDVVRSHSLPCILTNGSGLGEGVTHKHEDTERKPIFISPEQLKRKIRKRMMSCRHNNEKIQTEKLKRYEKQNELKAFKASLVTTDHEIGKLFFIDRKVTHAPSTPEVPESVKQKSILEDEPKKAKIRPLSLPPPRLPPIYKTKLFPIVPRNLEVEEDMFAPHPSMREKFEELEDCRYLRKPLG